MTEPGFGYLTPTMEVDVDDGADILEEICSVRRGLDTRVLEQTVTLAVELAREGREGNKGG